MPQDAFDLYHIYSFMFAREGHRMSSFAAAMGVVPKTIKRHMEKIDDPDECYWNKYGYYSIEEMRKLNKETMDMLSISNAKHVTEKKVSEYCEKMRFIHPHYIKFISIFYWIKILLDSQNEVYCEFYTKGFEYYFQQIKIFSQMLHAIYIEDKEKYQKLASEHSLPFAFSHEILWKSMVNKGITNDFKKIFRPCIFFFVLNIDLFCITPVLCSKDDALGASALLGVFDNIIKGDKKTARSTFVEALKEKIFDSIMYKEFSRQSGRKSKKKTLSSLYEFWVQDSNADSDSMKKLYQDVKCGKNLTSKRLYQFAELCSIAMCEDGRSKESIIKNIRNSFLVCCIVDEMCKDSVRYDVEPQYLFVELCTWRQWLCEHVYNCSVHE